MLTLFGGPVCWPCLPPSPPPPANTRHAGTPSLHARRQFQDVVVPITVPFAVFSLLCIVYCAGWETDLEARKFGVYGSSSRKGGGAGAGRLWRWARFNTSVACCLLGLLGLLNVWMTIAIACNAASLVLSFTLRAASAAALDVSGGGGVGGGAGRGRG